MTAPRWIAEAIEVVTSTIRGGEVFPGIPMIDAHRLPTALIERLPLEAMAASIRDLDYAGGDAAAVAVDQHNILVELVRVLTDGDPEVVELTEIYQGACRVLDEAGVPYERGLTDDGDPQIVRLNLAGRIRWLAQQRPTRFDLQRVEAERDAARAGNALLETVAAERDHLRVMYEGASDDLDRERSAHQEAEAAATNREIALTVDLDNARAAARAIKEREAACKGGIMLLLEGDLPAEKLRLALAELIGVEPGPKSRAKKPAKAAAKAKTRPTRKARK